VSARKLKFYDHARQRYADGSPIRDRHEAEFMIGDYAPEGGVYEGGEFMIALHRFKHPSVSDPWGPQVPDDYLVPQIRAFGDATGALKRAIKAGLLDVLDDVADRDEFARRLLALGFIDISDNPLPELEEAA
jgi:hypothetical protein